MSCWMQKALEAMKLGFVGIAVIGCLVSGEARAVTLIGSSVMCVGEGLVSDLLIRDLPSGKSSKA